MTVSETQLPIEFCLVAEAGILEYQALLLCLSIRQFAGRYANAKITIISPRPERRPGDHTIRQFLQLGANYCALDLKSPAPEYGTSFRVLALGWCARQAGPAILIQLDSDTLFLSEPDFNLEGYSAAARPVDLKGMSTSGRGDRLESIWEKMCEVCAVDIEKLGFVYSTIGNHQIRSHFNGGLYVARRELFVLIEECFLLITSANLKPFAGAQQGIITGTGLISKASFERWSTSQVAFSIAMAKAGEKVRVLPPTHNIPLHLFNQLTPFTSPIVHLHYHWLFQTAKDLT